MCIGCCPPSKHAEVGFATRKDEVHELEPELDEVDDDLPSLWRAR